MTRIQVVQRFEFQALVVLKFKFDSATRLKEYENTSKHTSGTLFLSWFCFGLVWFVFCTLVECKQQDSFFLLSSFFFRVCEVKQQMYKPRGATGLVNSRLRIELVPGSKPDRLFCLFSV